MHHQSGRRAAESRHNDKRLLAPSGHQRSQQHRPEQTQRSHAERQLKLNVGRIHRLHCHQRCVGYDAFKQRIAQSEAHVEPECPVRTGREARRFESAYQTRPVG
jgi:hypothetical protein